MEELKILENVGLTNAEAKTYLALIYLKESKTGPLCEKAKIPSSNIYSILGSLMMKGFVSYRIQNNIKIFIPSDPTILDNLFDKKQKDIEEEKLKIKGLINNLKIQQTALSPISKYKYYEGISGVKSVWLELTGELKNLAKGETIKVCGSIRRDDDYLVPVYNEFHKVRVKFKHPYKLVLPSQSKNYGKEREKTPLTEVRYTKLNNEGAITIIGNNLLLQDTTTKTARAFLIRDEVFVKTFKGIFDLLWKISLP